MLTRQKSKNFFERHLERHTDGEVEGEVAGEDGMEYGEVFAAVVVDGCHRLHAGIEAQHEIVEVQSQTETVGGSQLLVESVKPKLTARLLVVGA